jgi:hypothetical protein
MSRTTIQCPHCRADTRIDLSFQLSTQKCDRCGVRLSAVNTGSQASKEAVSREPPTWRRAAVGDWDDERPSAPAKPTKSIGSWAAVGAALLVAGGAMAVLASRRNAAVGPQPMDAQELGNLDFPVEDLAEDSTYKLLRSRLERASVVARQFLAATSPEEVLDLIHDRARLEPIVREYYTTGEGAGSLPLPPASLLPIERQLWIEEFRTALLHYTVEGGRTRAIALHLTDDDRFLVEWLSAVAFNEVPMAKFIEERQTTPRLFRLRGSLDDYFNLDFRDEREWLCLRLADSEDRNSVFGYARANAPTGKAILAAKLPNRPPGAPVLVRLRFPEHGRSGNQVEVVEFLGTGWVETIAASPPDDTQPPQPPPSTPQPPSGR